MSIAHHAIFHSAARQFIIATNGDPRQDKFLPWLQQPENHELAHAFWAAWGAGYREDSAQAFIEVLSVEFDAWTEENGIE